MTTTYASEQQQLRTLTPYAIDCLKSLNDRDEKALQTLRQQRALYELEIAAIDDVMREVEATIARRQAKARGDVIGQLPVEQPEESEYPSPFDASPSGGDDAGGHS